METIEKLVCSFITHFAFHFGTASVNREIYLAFFVCSELTVVWLMYLMSFNKCNPHATRRTRQTQTHTRQVVKSSLPFTSTFVSIQWHIEWLRFRVVRSNVSVSKRFHRWPLAFTIKNSNHWIIWIFIQLDFWHDFSTNEYWIAPNKSNFFAVLSESHLVKGGVGAQKTDVRFRLHCSHLVFAWIDLENHSLKTGFWIGRGRGNLIWDDNNNNK